MSIGAPTIIAAAMSYKIDISYYFLFPFDDGRLGLNTFQRLLAPSTNEWGQCRDSPTTSSGTTIYVNTPDLIPLS